MSAITVTAVSALPKPEPEPVMRGARSADIAQAPLCERADTLGDGTIVLAGLGLLGKCLMLLKSN